MLQAAVGNVLAFDPFPFGQGARPRPKPVFMDGYVTPIRSAGLLLLVPRPTLN